MATFKCDICDFEAVSEQQLAGHRFRIHNNREGAFYCNDCLHPCFSQYGVEIHQKHYCPYRKNVSVHRGELEPTCITLTSCEKCRHDLENKCWLPTKDGLSYFKTLFLCRECKQYN